MSSLISSNLSKRESLLKHRYPPNDTEFITKPNSELKSNSKLKPNNQSSFGSGFIYKKARVIKLSFVLAMLSFSAVGCATLQALEPTAILISDIKDIL